MQMQTLGINTFLNSIIDADVTGEKRLCYLQTCCSNFTLVALSVEENNLTTHGTITF